MPFIGTTPAQGFVSSVNKQSFTANGSTTSFTLAHPVSNANDLEVFVGNVRQEPTAAYTASGTTLDFGSGNAPPNGVNLYVIYKNLAQVTTTPPDGSVSNAKITAMASSKLTGALPAIDGSALTGVGLIKTADVEPSGTTIANFTSIPAGVNHIKVSGVGLSITSGSGVPNSYYVMRIGSSGSLEASGYTGSFMQQNSAGTDGIASNIAAGSPGVSGNSWPLTKATSASSSMNINADLRLVDSDAHVWAYSFISSADGTAVVLGAGQKTLSARLDILGVYTYSGYTFDAGKISIQYE